MTVLDAFAVIALLNDEPARVEVEQLLHVGEPCRISVVNLAETVNVLGKAGGFEPATIRQGLQLLRLSGLLIEPADAELAELAGLLRATHYRRSDGAISLADCFALALATTTGERLATADIALLKVAVKAGARVIPLPDSTGRRPQM